MVAALIALGVGLALIVVGRMNVAEAVSPDGHRYLALGSGERVSMPFALRWPALASED